MSKTQTIIFTTPEVSALCEFVATSESVHRTYKVLRDKRNVLWIVQPNERLIRLSA